MAGKSPSRSKILNDTHDLMTLMTHAACAFHAYISCVICSGINSCIFCRICVCFSKIILIFVGKYRSPPASNLKAISNKIKYLQIEHVL